MRCEALADQIPGVIDSTAALDAAARSHVDTCLRCQAELAQYRRLARVLRSLRAQQVAPLDALFDDIIAVLDDPELLRSSSRLGRRAAYLSGIAAATAAGAAGAIVIASPRGAGASPVERATPTVGGRRRLRAPPIRLRTAEGPVLTCNRANPPRAVAQLVEHRSPKPAVGGSSPSCPASVDVPRHLRRRVPITPRKTAEK